MDTGDGHRFSLLDKKPVHAILLIFKQVKHQYNLKYFSYHHHYNNEHYISKFWQVRNLRLPFHYLPKLPFTCQNYHFGKYVGWSCLSVCLSVCLYGTFTKSQERLSQPSPNLVTSKYNSMIHASSLHKNVGQITRSLGQKVGQTLNLP